MIAFSAFNGLGFNALALKALGVKVDLLFSSEIDKYANKAASILYPASVQLGDITKWREWPIDWSTIDLIVGGSPCQGFSIAGKKAGTTAEVMGQKVIVTDRELYLQLKAAGAEFLSCSHLFWEFVLLLDHIKAANLKVKFMLENVIMSKQYRDMITEALGVECVRINASLVSAQNRPRLYWSNAGSNVTQPEDRGLLLRDVVEFGVDPKYNLSDKILAGFARKVERRKGMPGGFGTFTIKGLFEKAGCLTARYSKMAITDTFINTDGKPRRLTPRECGRLQSMDETDINKLLASGISNAQLYKMLGNGWNLAVIIHVYRAMGL